MLTRQSSSATPTLAPPRVLFAPHALASCLDPQHSHGHGRRDRPDSIPEGVGGRHGPAAPSAPLGNEWLTGGIRSPRQARAGNVPQPPPLPPRHEEAPPEADRCALFRMVQRAPLAAAGPHLLPFPFSAARMALLDRAKVVADCVVGVRKRSRQLSRRAYVNSACFAYGRPAPTHTAPTSPFSIAPQSCCRLEAAAMVGGFYLSSQRGRTVLSIVYCCLSFC